MGDNIKIVVKEVGCTDEGRNVGKLLVFCEHQSVVEFIERRGISREADQLAVQVARRNSVRTSDTLKMERTRWQACRPTETLDTSLTQSL
jgi:hypothetical protein